MCYGPDWTSEYERRRDEAARRQQRDRVQPLRQVIAEDVADQAAREKVEGAK